MIRNLTTILTLDCRSAAQLLSDRSERRLKGYERLALRVHLLICRGCRRYRAYLASIRAALGSESREGQAESASLASSVDGDDRLSADARQRLKRLLEQG